MSLDFRARQASRVVPAVWSRGLLQACLGTVLALCGWSTAAFVHADSFQSVFSFPAPNGLSPQAGLLLASDGNFYGTTTQGGDAGGAGTVFKLTSAGVLTTLHSFSGADGQAPGAALVQGGDGNLYGTTTTGGSANSGTIFKISPGGTLTTLHTFTGVDGNLPMAALVQGSDGNFYGTTNCGGPSQSCYGTIFQITPGGIFTSLHDLSDSDGGTASALISALVQGMDGNFYGTAGAIAFRITSSGTFTTLHAFSPAIVAAGLTQGSDGNFYGVTETGGSANTGSVFQMTPSGTVTTLHSLSGSDGKYPVANLALGADGNFYGTTEGDRAFGGGGLTPITDYGTVFKVTPAGTFTTLHTFSSTDGSGPVGSVTVVHDGSIYGTTPFGSTSGTGNVFKISSTGTFTTLLSFSAPVGGRTLAPLLIGGDGNFYGTAQSGGVAGGFGTVFKLAANGTASALHSFDQIDGWFPFAGLVLGGDGKFYGTTRGNEGPDAPNPQGSVFSITSDGTFTALHAFTGPDGANPGGSLIQGADGRFYGTTAFGGSSDGGTVFAITSSGTLSTLHNFSFGSDGGGATMGLTSGGDGNFYGVAGGTVFKITPTGTLTPLHTFSFGPVSQLLLGGDGNLYGIDGNSGGQGVDPYSGSAVFEITPSGVLTVLHVLDASEGNFLVAGLIAGYDGNFYGTAPSGGAFNGGTVFRVSPKGVFTVLHSLSQPIGGGTQAPLVLGADGYLYGTTSGGGSAGLGAVFRLLQPPAAPQGLSAAPGNGFASLHWSAAQGAVSYNVFRSTSPGGESATPLLSGITGTSVTVNGLTNGTTYYFTVEAVNAGGSSLPGNEASVEPVPPPAAPTGLTASPGNASITLQWNAVNFAASYNIYQGTIAGGEASMPVLTGVTATHATLSGLSNGTTYYFVVKAVNAVATGPASNEISAAPIAPPPAPASLAAVAGDAQVTLHWAAATRAASYDVYAGTSVGGESDSPILSGVNATGVTVGGLHNGTAYYFVVRAVNAGGSSPASNEANAMPVAPPPAPSGLTAAAGDRSITLQWTPAPGADSYSIYQGSTTGGESATPVQSGITATGATVSGLVNGTTYYYVVRAANGSGNSAASNEASGTPVLRAPPLAPTGVSVVPGNAQINISWTASAGATSYSIYQGTVAGGEGSTPVQSGITGTSAVVTALSNGATYYFVITAANPVGTSPPSAEATATLAPAAPSAVVVTAGNGQVNISWAPSSGATSYNIYQGTAAGGETSTPVQSGIAGTAAVVTGLSNGTTYYFAVRAVDAGGIGPASQETSATPSAPSSGGGGVGLQTLLMLAFAALARRDALRRSGGINSSSP